MNESPLFHSSASKPLSRKRPSALALPPPVALSSRARAPSLTEFAPAADCTSAGLMTSGSSTLRTSVGLQAASARTPIANAAHIVLYEVILIFLESEVETK